MHHSSNIRQSGNTLVEVLVTVVIVSVALLASIGLQLQSKRSNFDSAQRTTAAHLAEDMLERMRANPRGLIDYTLAGEIGGGSLGADPADDCALPEANCSPEGLAGYDLWQWEQLLDGAFQESAAGATGGLAFPVACITGPAFGGNGVYEVAIAWRGMTETVDSAADDCGAGSGDYGDGDAYRRVLVVRSFINAI